MTLQMHVELAALCQALHSSAISEEEWALLQIHLAYCDSCRKVFVESQQVSAAVASTSPLSSG
jgi:hypothetical protein